MTARFENSPINELVIATYFDPPLFALRSEHIGLLWSRIRDKFPTVEQQPPVGGAEVFESGGGEVFPMPRFWFVAEDAVNLIQVQKNAFMLNWRRRDAKYPHFDENLKPIFDRYYQVFDDFVREEAGISDLRIDQCELTYINTIAACEYWRGPEDTSIVIPSFRVPDARLPMCDQTAFNCTYVYVLDKDLQLRVSVRSAELQATPGTPVLVIEIKAIGRLGKVGKSVADEWFEKAHEAIVRCFVNLTNEEIQTKHWKLIPEGA